MDRGSVTEDATITDHPGTFLHTDIAIAQVSNLRHFPNKASYLTGWVRPDLDSVYFRMFGFRPW